MRMAARSAAGLPAPAPWCPELGGKQKLGNLDGVQRGTLSEVVTDSEQGEPVGTGVPDPSDKNIVAPCGIERGREDVR